MIEAIRYFADEDICVRTLSAIRWPDGRVPCPACGCTENYYLAKRLVWKCKGCARQFSIKVGTVLEDSPVKLSKWLPAIWLITNAKNGVSSYEIHRALGVTQKTAWFMLHRIRLAMGSGTFEKLRGRVEVDETFIGGKNKNKHLDKKITRGRGPVGKAIVVGFLERGGKAHARVAKNRRSQTLRGQLLDTVEVGSAVYTDENIGYRDIADIYNHEWVRHMDEWVRGEVHTNGLENFWSLLKRGLKGTYVAVEPFHLFRYVDEQVFRFNARRGTDSERFAAVLSQIVGRRVTYKELTGQMEA